MTTATGEKTVNKHGARVGDYLTCFWGYDQTNVSIFKVTKVTASSVCIVSVDRYGNPDSDSLNQNGIKRTSKGFMSPSNKDYDRLYAIKVLHGEPAWLDVNWQDTFEQNDDGFNGWSR